MAITYPPVLLNHYLAEKVVQRLPNHFSSVFRFFPTSPIDINSVTEGFPEESTDVFAVYDRMFRYRKNSFPHIKNEQTVYYFYKNGSDPEALIETSQVVHDLLDREDESALELNDWIRSKIGSNNLITFGSGSLAREFKPVFFHNTKVFQLQESRDILSFSTVRNYTANKLIIDYQYHAVDYS